MTAGAGDLACNQQPGDRFLWVERGFCGLGVHGPEPAPGMAEVVKGCGARLDWTELT
jgi:hypothetical protein